MIIFKHVMNRIYLILLVFSLNINLSLFAQDKNEKLSDLLKFENGDKLHGKLVGIKDNEILEFLSFSTSCANSLIPAFIENILRGTRVRNIMKPIIIAFNVILSTATFVPALKK